MDANSKGPTKVLIVDDDEKVRDILGFFFSEKNFTIEEAENGLEALEKVAQNKPDIIILDSTMPEMDGFQTCRRFKEDPDTKHIPIIFFTAETLKVVIEKTEGKADDYIEKPGIEELFEKIDTLLERKG